MKYEIVSIRDRAAVAFGRPTYTLSIGAAIRSFQDEVNRNDPQNVMFGHAEDFDLFHLGSFDDQEGKFDCGTPRQIAVGKDLKKAV